MDQIIESIANVPDNIVPYLPQLLGSQLIRDPAVRILFEARLIPVIAQRIQRIQMDAHAQEERDLQEAIARSLVEQRFERPRTKNVTLRRHTIGIDEFRQELQCVVCLNQLLFGDEDCVEVKCGHLFHRKCIAGWVKENDTCPLCRADIGD